MKKRLLFLVTLAFLGLARSEDVLYQGIGPFGGLNNTDSPLAIPANKAQDLLNVDVSPSGKSIKKREGYGLFSNLAITTSAVHGVHNFFDSSGNTVDLYFNDTRISASVNGGSVSVLSSTGPSGATWQCVDSQGFAYCNNTARTSLLKTNGASFSYTTTVNSTGTMVAVTPERLATAGFQEAPNRIDISKANDFGTWTIGSAGTAATQFTVVAPGSRITHIVYAFGRLIWFKDSSFGYIFIGQEEAQADWQLRIISPNVGTLDNTSVYWQGILYFRGQDGHIYAYDGSNLEKTTRDLEGTISVSGNRTVNSWTQTSESDFAAGYIPPDVSTSIVVGSLVSRTTSYSITSQADWASSTYDGKLYIDTETVSGNLQTTFPDTFTSFRTSTATNVRKVWSTWATSGATNLFTVTSGQAVLRGTYNSGFTQSVGMNTIQPTNSLTSGVTFYLDMVSMNDATGSNVVSFYFTVSDAIYTDITTARDNGVWFLINSTNTSSSTDYRVLTKDLASSGQFSSSTTIPINFWINSTHYGLYAAGSLIGTAAHGVSVNNQLYVHMGSILSSGASNNGVTIDNFTITPQTFTYTSSTYDTGISSPVWASISVSSNASSGSFTLTSQVSADGVSFDSGVTVASGSVIASNPKRYIKFAGVFDNRPLSLPGSVVSLSDYAFSAGSSGTFRSAVKNAPNLSAWDTFSVERQDNGGSQTFYMRSSTNSFSVNSSTPSWSSVSANAIPSLSTGVYFQVRDDFYAPAGSNTVTLSEFTVNWFEGQASDKAYGAYFNDAIWWSIASGVSVSTNNRTLRLDLINGDWYLYDIGANGFLVRNNSLYFGSSTEGKIFKFGDSDSDNGAAINAYWKSKDFVQGNPFVKKEFTSLSVSVGSVQNSSMTVTYAVDGSSSTTYQFSLYTGSSYYKHFNKNLPLGRIGSSFNVQVGNNGADQPFEVFAIQYGFREKPWVPTP